MKSSNDGIKLSSSFVFEQLVQEDLEVHVGDDCQVLWIRQINIQLAE